MIIRELTKEQAVAELKAAGLAHHITSLPYRGYAVTLSDDGKRRRFIGHHPGGKYLLQELPSEKEKFTTTMERALEKLKEYASEDELDANRLNPFLQALEKGDMEKAKELRGCLVSYLACHWSIDELHANLGG